jgi:hypothetical protein
VQAKERVRGLEQLIALAERLYGNSDQPASTSNASGSKTRSDPPNAPAPAPSSADGPLAGLGAREAAVELLKMRGGTWRVDKATKEMLGLGWQTNSPAPETVVRSALMRDARIERVAPGEFRYRQEPSSSINPAESTPNGGGEGQPSVIQPYLKPLSTGS